MDIINQCMEYLKIAKGNIKRDGYLTPDKNLSSKISGMIIDSKKGVDEYLDKLKKDMENMQRKINEKEKTNEKQIQQIFHNLTKGMLKKIKFKK